MTRLPAPSEAVRASAVAALPLVALAAGLALRLAGESALARWVFIAGALPVLVVLLVQIVSSLRRGDLGLDIVAALSLSAAIAVGEELAAVIVALMYAGGQLLERFAAHRARREMTALLSRVPRSAMRHRDGGLEEIPIEAVAPGDRLYIHRGDVLPVDGAVVGGTALLDLSALTGESLPVRLGEGDAAMSGSTNAGDAFDLLASRPAAASTYAGIVRLVAAAERSRAPMARLADRYAIVFLAATVALAGGAWLWTGDPVRAVAVLVVATPCPLILALPVALVAGLSRAARDGVLIKGGKVLEALAGVKSIVIDKTGTLTEGRPALVATEIVPGFGEDEVVRLGATLDQATRHPIGEALVAEARRRGLGLGVPADAAEMPGEGVSGEVEGRRVVVGGRRYVAESAGLSDYRRAPRRSGEVRVAVAIDGRLAGELVFADRLREGSEALVAALRTKGVERIVLATGDRREVATMVAERLGLDALQAELTPDRKVLLVVAERKNGPVMMVGDGVNDAPALAAADVGVAMGARGAAASAQAADVVLLVDRLDRVLVALDVAHRSRAIAFQSVVAGIGLSVAGMIAAAFGLLAPVQGALLQEAIDVAVILNALRALR